MEAGHDISNFPLFSQCWQESNLVAYVVEIYTHQPSIDCNTVLVMHQREGKERYPQSTLLFFSLSITVSIYSHICDKNVIIGLQNKFNNFSK